MTTRAIIALATCGLAACAGTAHAGFIYDEAVDGDLSNDRANPTAFALSEGISVFTMDVIDSDGPNGDLDYFTVSIGAGLSIDSITLVSSDNPVGGFDPTAFIAMQLGTEVTVDPASPDPSPLSGFVIGSPPLVGTNILPDLAGLSGPTVGAGDYSYWVQQTGADLTRITLSFNVVPAPGFASALGCVGLLAARRRR